eukprot:1142706-Pelagomonas_calceolata.AAC.4
MPEPTSSAKCLSSRRSTSASCEGVASRRWPRASMNLAVKCASLRMDSKGWNDALNWIRAQQAREMDRGDRQSKRGRER